MLTDRRYQGGDGLTWKKPGGIGPPGMPSPGGIPPITGLGAAAALYRKKTEETETLQLPALTCQDKPIEDDVMQVKPVPLCHNQASCTLYSTD